MSTALREQIRQLTTAFDQVVEEITVDEVRRRNRGPSAVTEDEHGAELLITTGQRPRSRWLSIAAAAVLIVGVVGSLMWLNRNRPTPSASPSTSAPPASAPSSTTVVTRGDTVPYGPLDYATTEQELPMWPLANVSDPPATTTGYGMALCDSGYGTKILRVDPASGPSHAYSGTVCVFIDLAAPRVDAVTSCATSTERFNYARCQRRTDLTDTAGAGTSQRVVADAEDAATMRAFPSATTWDQAELFDATVSAASTRNSSPAFSDGAVTVTLDTATGAGVDSTVDQPGVCFEIDLPGAHATGCVGRGLLATGLAYGAFQDGDGPIELVGIVPDEVTAIEIDGQIITPTNNVWHHTTTSTGPLTISVRAADGRTASTA